MLNLQKSEQAISVEQNLYNRVCVSQPHLNVTYCILMDRVITQLLGFFKLYFNLNTIWWSSTIVTTEMNVYKCTLHIALRLTNKTFQVD